jgi:hypothetical protein
MLIEVEKLEGRRWSLLPHKGSFVDSHIALFDTAMIDLLKSNCLDDNRKTREYFKDMGSKIWNIFFRIPKDRGPYIFNDYITTNGYVVSLNYKILPDNFETFTKERNYHSLSLEEKYNVLTKYEKVKAKMKDNKDNKDNKESNGRIKQVTELIEEDFNRILGLDPGSRSLFTCVDKSQIDEKHPYGKVLKCGSKEYKHMTGMKKKTQNVNKRKERVPVLKEMGNNVSLKTSSFEKYKENLKKLLSIEEEVLKEYNRSWYKKINFTCYQKKQKAFKKLAKRLQGDEDEEKVLIGWGDGGSGSHLKGSKVAGKGFKRYIEKNTKMTVMDVNEDLTTKKCSNCEEDTKKTYITKDLNEGKRRSENKRIERVANEEERLEKEGERIRKLKERKLGIKIEKKEKKEVVTNVTEYEVVMKKVDVYGVKQCVNCGIKWGRDVNASENMLRITLCRLRRKERPIYLCRKPKPCTEISSECLVQDSQSTERGSIMPGEEVKKPKRTIVLKKKLSSPLDKTY